MLILSAAATNIYVVLAMARHCIKMYSFNPDDTPTGHPHFTDEGSELQKRSNNLHVFGGAAETRTLVSKEHLLLVSQEVLVRSL